MARGTPKMQLMVRVENAAVTGFYHAIGYETEDRVLLTRLAGRWAPLKDD